VDANPSSSQATRIAFSLKSLLLFTAGVAVVLACGRWYYQAIVEPHRESDAIQSLLHSLAKRRPANVTRGQWGSAVSWTLNLHGNSLLPFEADGPTLRRFRARLEERLAGPVDLSTIDWIWDEYALLTPHGREYQRFKEMRDEEIGTVGPNDDIWSANVP